MREYGVWNSANNQWLTLGTDFREDVIVRQGDKLFVVNDYPGSVKVGVYKGHNKRSILAYVRDVHMHVKYIDMSKLMVCRIYR